MKQLLCVVALSLLPLAAEAKPKPLPVKSAAGGASKRWACNMLAETGCDLAKRCDPDKAQRRCRIVRSRCDLVANKPTHAYTEDDVDFCNQALAELQCRQATFDNEVGVGFDFKSIDNCKAVSNDDPFIVEEKKEEEPRRPAKAPKADAEAAPAAAPAKKGKKSKAAEPAAEEAAPAPKAEPESKPAAEAKPETKPAPKAEPAAEPAPKK